MTGAGVALVRDGLVRDGMVRDGLVQERWLPDHRGVLAQLPALANAVLAGRVPDAIAVTTGPGSFTGIRAALALGHGLALAFGCSVRGVTVGQAMQGAAIPGRQLWIATDTRRGRVYLERFGPDRPGLSVMLDALPIPDVPIAVAGDAAEAVYAALQGRDMVLLPQRRPLPAGIALATDPALPLYSDPPAVRAP